MTTAIDLIKGSVRLLRILDADIIPTSRETVYPLEALQYLLDSWSNDSQTIYNIKQDTLTLTTGQQLYTIGVGGDFNTARPIKILSAKIRNSGVDYDLPIMAYNDWAEVVNKSDTGLPQYMYCDYSAPLANIYLFPKPTASNTILLFSEKPLNSPTTLTDEIILPPGFLRALKFNLAVEIAAEYGAQPSQDVARIAQESLELLRKTTRRINTSQTDPKSLPPNKA